MKSNMLFPPVSKGSRGATHYHPLVYRIRRLVFMPLVLLLMILVMTGCLEDPVEKLTDTIEQVSNNLTNESYQWREEWQRTRKELPADVRDEFDRAFERAMAAANESVSCEIDFIRNRLRRDLRAIIDQETISEPVICKLEPDAALIQLDRRYYPEGGSYISFVGYDLDDEQVEILLEGIDGTTVDLTRWLSDPTHYRLTVDLSRVSFDSNSQKIVVRWPGYEKSVGVAQPKILKAKVTVNFNDIKILDPIEDTCGDTTGELVLMIRVNGVVSRFPPGEGEELPIIRNQTYPISVPKFEAVLEKGEQLVIEAEGIEIDSHQSGVFHPCGTGEDDNMGRNTDLFNISEDAPLHNPRSMESDRHKFILHYQIEVEWIETR